MDFVTMGQWLSLWANVLQWYIVIFPENFCVLPEEFFQHTYISFIHIVGQTIDNLWRRAELRRSPCPELPLINAAVPKRFLPRITAVLAFYGPLFAMPSSRSMARRQWVNTCVSDAVLTAWGLLVQRVHSGTGSLWLPLFEVYLRWSLITPS
jgi:hypothetical protein